MPASVSSTTRAVGGIDAESASALDVALRVGLAVGDVVGADDRAEAGGEARRLDDGLDLGARGAGTDRERDADAAKRTASRTCSWTVEPSATASR